LRRATGIACGNGFLEGIPCLGIILLMMFAIDQIKIEFLRYDLSDYQHYIFTLFAFFIACADLLYNGKLKIYERQKDMFRGTGQLSGTESRNG
jgi:hypothetical protein